MSLLRPDVIKQHRPDLLERHTNGKDEYDHFEGIDLIVAFCGGSLEVT